LRGLALGDTQLVDGRGVPARKIWARMPGTGREEMSIMDQAG